MPKRRGCFKLASGLLDSYIGKGLLGFIWMSFYFHTSKWFSSGVLNKATPKHSRTTTRPTKGQSWPQRTSYRGSSIQFDGPIEHMVGLPNYWIFHGQEIQLHVSEINLNKMKFRRFCLPPFFVRMFCFFLFSCPVVFPWDLGRVVRCILWGLP